MLRAANKPSRRSTRAAPKAAISSSLRLSRQMSRKWFAPLVCTLLLASLASLSSASPAGGESYPGEIVSAIQLPIDRQAVQGNGSAAVGAPHVVELHTATWCVPCRSVEGEMDDLATWWPAVLVIAEHSSVDSPDPLALEESLQLKQHYDVNGWPTLVVDGHWKLLGEAQSPDLTSLLSNLTTEGADLPLAGAPTLAIDSWVRDCLDCDITVGWTVSGDEGEYLLDIMLVQDGMHTTALTLDDVLRVAEVLRPVNGNETGSTTLVVNLSEGGEDARLVLLLRRAGTPETEAGSQTPLASALPAEWFAPRAREEIDSTTILLISVLLLVLMVPAFRHTVPALFRSSRQTEGDRPSDEQGLLLEYDEEE